MRVISATPKPLASICSVTAGATVSTALASVTTVSPVTAGATVSTALASVATVSPATAGATVSTWSLRRVTVHAYFVFSKPTVQFDRVLR
ncbi:hypothetical protein PF004_g7002 [Phytophthora fragariae]|uniref:Uncharacterized protein n=1 Tax=Phytophthora fragariae TaxID=53985 RepID=A0A6G0PBB1_9STRA|nr:hypothetical protein PF004_g7002 [Phytophthora fragariae]